MRIHYFPLMGYSALDDFSLNGGWLELKAGIDLTKPQKNLKKHDFGKPKNLTYFLTQKIKVWENCKKNNKFLEKIQK